MNAQVVFIGPSTAGKTSLMLGLSHLESTYNFTVDKTWTTRPRRPGENDDENIFVNQHEFDKKRHKFLLPFRTFPTYEYAIAHQTPLSVHELRMRILTPTFAQKFRQLVQVRTIICSVSPYNKDPLAVMNTRDPSADHADIAARCNRFYKDDQDAIALADVRFQNYPGISLAAANLGAMLIDYIQDTVNGVVV